MPNILIARGYLYGFLCWTQNIKLKLPMTFVKLYIILYNLFHSNMSNLVPEKMFLRGILPHYFKLRETSAESYYGNFGLEYEKFEEF